MNEDGELMGIATAKADVEYFLNKYGSIPEGISFAVDLESILLFLAANKFTVKEINSFDGSKPILEEIVGLIECESQLITNGFEIHLERLRQLSSKN